MKMNVIFKSEDLVCPMECLREVLRKTMTVSWNVVFNSSQHWTSGADSYPIIIYGLNESQRKLDYC